MDKKILTLPKVHVQLSQLPRIASISFSVLTILVMIGIGYMGWNDIVRPYQQQTVSQNALTAKADSLNVKDLQSVQAGVAQKTKLDPATINFNAFGQ